MRLVDLLDRRRLIVPLAARSVRQATARLAETLVATGVVVDQQRLARLLDEEWPEDVVSVGGRAFLPHFRTDAVQGLTVAVGISPQPVCRENDPSRCARIVVLIVAPPREASAYLEAMGAFARALANDEILEGLHAAARPEDVLGLSPLAAIVLSGEVTVRDVMSTDLLTFGPEIPLGEAARRMLASNVRSAPVIGASGEVLGLLTDGHLLRSLLSEKVQEMSTGRVRSARRRGAKGAARDPREIPVRHAMDRSVLCLSEDQTVAEVAALMLAKDVDRFPVTREGALVGFLTRRDIIRKLLAT